MSKVEIPDPINVAISPFRLDGGVDMGLDDINMDLGLDDVNASITLDVKPVTVDLGLNNIKADMGLDNVKVEAGLVGDKNKPVTVDLGLDNIKVDLGLDNVKVDLGLDNINTCLSIAFSDIPKVKVHYPIKYEFGFGLFGLKILNFSISGESMFVTEDNHPHSYDECKEGLHPDYPEEKEESPPYYEEKEESPPFNEEKEESPPFYKVELSDEE